MDKNIEVSASEPDSNVTGKTISYETRHNKIQTLTAVVKSKNSLLVIVPESSYFSPNGNAKLELSRSEEGIPFKSYAVPELKQPNPQVLKSDLSPILNRFRLSEIQNHLSKKIKSFLPVFICYIAYKAGLETLHIVELAVARRTQELGKNSIVDKSKTYYQMVSGGRWYWYLQWTDKNGKRENKPLCRCKGLELPPINKDSDIKINPHTANWSFSKRYLVEISEVIITSENKN